jgi:hypothetical protein
MTTFKSIALLGFVFIHGNASAAIIGTNPPALPLTLERIANVPADKQPGWKAYLKNSDRQLRTDQEFFQKELRQNHIAPSTTPPEAHGVRGIGLEKPADWYAQTEALRIADILVSFQTPAGGWSKNIDMTRHRRAPGERFSADNTSRFPMPADNDAPRDRGWNYVGTFDNDATITQLRFFLPKSSLPLEQKTAKRIAHPSFGDLITFSLPNTQTAVGRKCGRCKADIMTRSHITTTQ